MTYLFTIALTIIVAAAGAALVLLRPQSASAHCDTWDGPTAKDGRLALQTGNINHALKWIMPEHESELRHIFAQVMRVRALGPDAQDLADQHFLEHLVRLHRAGEGAPFEGLKPHGTPFDPRVAAADQSIDSGSLEPLKALVPQDRWADLERLFSRAMELKHFDTDDVEAGREYIEAYVQFFKFAEGEEHVGHGHAHGHAHGHGEHAPAGHHH